jgi:hypothetical protein
MKIIAILWPGNCQAGDHSVTAGSGHISFRNTVGQEKIHPVSSAFLCISRLTGIRCTIHKIPAREIPEFIEGYFPGFFPETISFGSAVIQKNYYVTSV